MPRASRPQNKVRFKTHPASSIVPVRAIGQHRNPLADLYHTILTRSWPEFCALMALAFVLVNLLFAGGFLLVGGIANARPGSFWDAFFFSVQTLATIGYGGMYPTGIAANLLVTAESFAGILAVAVITGVTFAKFARPRAQVLFSEKIVMTPRHGVPHLMFRMANWRHNYVVEAQLRVLVLCVERTPEGEVHRVPVELRLVRERTALFVLTWTAMHRIDEESPFHEPGGEWDAAVARLREREAEIVLNLSGLDDTSGQTIHARHLYKLDDIVWNARFADVVTTYPDGTREIDYRHFHEVVPIK